MAAVRAAGESAGLALQSVEASVQLFVETRDYMRLKDMAEASAVAGQVRFVFTTLCTSGSEIPFYENGNGTGWASEIGETATFCFCLGSIFCHLTIILAVALLSGCACQVPANPNSANKISLCSLPCTSGKLQFLDTMADRMQRLGH